MAVAPVVIAPALPDNFKLSYEDFESYPHNLMYRTACTAVVKAYEARLDEVSPKASSKASSTLFIGEDEAADIPFRDFRGRGKFSHLYLKFSALTPFAAFERRNIFNDSKLKDWIGDQSSIDPLVATLTGELATKPDPKCRFM